MTDLTDDKPKPKTGKRRKIFRRVLLCAVIAAIAFFTARVVRVWTGKPTIAVDYIAELNRLTKPENYDPNQNAASYYEQALAAYVETRKTWSVWPADLNQLELDELKKYIEDNTESIGLLRQIAAKPYFWVEYQTPEKGRPAFVVFRPFGGMQLRQLLCLTAELKAAEGQIEEAFEDVYNTYSMGLQLDKPKSLMMQIMGTLLEETACRTGLEIISRTHLTNEQLTGVHQKFEELVAKSNPVLHLDSEQLAIYDIAQRLFTDDGRGSGHLILTELYGLEEELGEFEYGRKNRDNGNSNWLTDFFGIHKRERSGRLGTRIRRTRLAMRGPDRRGALADAEKYYVKLEELGWKTPWQLNQMGIRGTDDVLQIPDDNVLKEFLHNPALISLKSRTHATKAALLTVLGILRYKADTGGLPENLEQLLKAGYIKELPRDPYGPGSLVYRQENQQFVLYSFGSDFEDDGLTAASQSHRNDRIYWPVKNGQKL